MTKAKFTVMIRVRRNGMEKIVLQTNNLALAYSYAERLTMSPEVQAWVVRN